MGKENHSRPILLSIFAILSILLGLVVLLAGIAVAVGGTISLPFSPPAGLSLVVFGGIIAFVGLVEILVGVALFSGERWGWWFAVVMTVISLIFSIVTLNVLTAAINIIILLYLNTKNTKGWFDV